MDDTASNIIDRQTALADFDHARDDFEDTLSQVPPEALAYKPEGDDYTIGGQVAHITESLRQYAALLDLMREAEFQEVRQVAAQDDTVAVEGDPAADIAMDLEGDTPNIEADRRAALDAMEDAHDKLAAKLGELAYEHYTFQAPVYYLGSEEDYPTSASDILGWVTGHYREHAQQTLDMLAGWKGLGV